MDATTKRRVRLIDMYIRLESRLERATSPEEEERLIHRLGSLEIVEGITTNEVEARKIQRRQE